MSDFTLNPKKIALVLIDLQHGIIPMPMEPRSGPEVVATSRKLAEAFRAQGALVVYVRVDVNDMLPLLVDTSHRKPDSQPFPPIASELVPEAGFTAADLLITKRHWGAFGGTALETELKSRGIESIVLGGIATNFGVESTAREATGLGFSVVLAEDACATRSAAAHRFAFDNIFPLMARVRSADEIVAALA